MTNETTASQPKSIGDDAQFRNALSTWYRAKSGASRPQKVERDFAALIAVIDNFCAPAAQASATIQAAPDTSKLTRYDYEQIDGETAYIAEDNAFGRYVLLSDVEALLSATIQKPVMVAEPVGTVSEAFKAAFLKWNGFHTEAEIAAEWAAHGGLCGTFFREGLAAAPMVAEPAGVAMAKLRDELLSMSATRTTDGLMLPRAEVERIVMAASSATLAATVKAVPKIRITLRQARRLVEFFGGHDADMTVTERPADWEQVEEGKEGLYAFCTEYPEDGAQFLGATETDDELMRLGSVKAVPSEALDAEGERAGLREEQARAVMPLIGPLLDAYEGVDKDDLEEIAPDLLRYLGEINRGMEGSFAAPLADKTGGGDHE